MCLAIAMYLITGILTVLFQVGLALGIFILTLLGKIILFVCAMIYTVGRPITWPTDYADRTTIPFETMYPEYNFEDDLEAMSRVSLETISSQDDTPQDIHRVSDSIAISTSFYSDELSSETQNSLTQNILSAHEISPMVNRSVDVLFPESDDG